MTIAPGKALLIVNNHSRRGSDMATLAAELLDRNGVQVVCKSCDGHALSYLIRHAGPDIDRVIIGGGDGTLNAALPGIIARGLPIGILPLGTANDLARTLGIPIDLDAAVKVVTSGEVRRIDVGQVNGHPFFNVASIGLGVDLARALKGDVKKRWGRLGYLITALAAVRRLRPFSAEITLNGVIHRTRTIHISVGNGRHYGGGMTVSENARIDDGRLDFCSLEVASIWGLLRLLPALRSGKFDDWKEVQVLDCREIVIHTHRPRSVNTDGEITTRTPAVFSILPKAVSVFVPRAPGEAGLPV